MRRIILACTFIALFWSPLYTMMIYLFDYFFCSNIIHVYNQRGKILKAMYNQLVCILQNWSFFNFLTKCRCESLYIFKIYLYLCVCMKWRFDLSRIILRYSTVPLLYAKLRDFMVYNKKWFISVFKLLSIIMQFVLIESNEILSIIFQCV